MPDLVLTSAMRCPGCGHVETLAMPTDACVVHHECTACGIAIRPMAGDCCVFCSHGSVPCPPMQNPGRGRSGCGSAS